MVSLFLCFRQGCLCFIYGFRYHRQCRGLALSNKWKALHEQAKINTVGLEKYTQRSIFRKEVILLNYILGDTLV